MGTSRCWQDNVVQGFVQKKKRVKVSDRKKEKRLAVRAMVKKLKAAGKKVDLQAVNQQVLMDLKRKKQSTKKTHSILAI